jgi:phenylalanyl-tRNA synthetase beta chain
VRATLLGAGLSELVTHSLTSPESTGRLDLLEGDGYSKQGERLARIVVNPAGVYAREALTLPVTLLNPPNRERTELRISLVPSLLDEVARNLRHTDERVAFFETARTYFRRPVDLPYERRTLAIALSGRRRPTSWQDPTPGPFSFYDLKGAVEAVMEALQVRDWRVEAGSHPALHPGRAAALCLAGEPVGYLGELHPLVAAAFDIEQWPALVAELDLDSIFPHASDTHIFHPIPRYPAARRDIAAVVDEDIAAADLVSTILEAGGELLESARIFDVYRGDPLPHGKKSLAVALEFRSPGSTLTQEDVNDEMERIVGSLTTRLGAVLRE